MKYKYILTINKEPTTKSFFTFPYGHSRNIKMKIERNCAEIEYESAKDFSEDIIESYLGGLLKEGIKRIALVHILKCKKCIDIKSAVVRVISGKGAEKVVDLSEDLKMEMMIPMDADFKNLKGAFTDEVIKNILAQSKSDYDSKESALIAYICSKAMKTETERFLYTWMTFNGFYSTLITGKNMYGKDKTDKDKIEEIVVKYGLGKRISKQDDRADIAKKVMVFINNLWPENYVNLKDERSAEARELKKLLVNSEGRKLNITPYGYIITDYAYYLRCTLFHANKPVYLFAFKNDWEIRNLKLVSDMLGEFLDSHIVELFA